jgi:ABC-type nitrate/sulfonate/bicarbonate transport system substrate-binding protein
MLRPFTIRYHSCLRNLLLLPLLCLPLILCTSCDKQPRTSGPPKKITIAYSTAANAILVYIAFAQGYFAEEGLDASPQPHAFGKPALNAVIEGKADLATVADTPIGGTNNRPGLSKSCWWRTIRVMRTWPAKRWRGASCTTICMW